jgi:hypothetical protein
VVVAAPTVVAAAETVPRAAVATVVASVAVVAVASEVEAAASAAVADSNTIRHNYYQTQLLSDTIRGVFRGGRRLSLFVLYFKVFLF